MGALARRRINPGREAVVGVGSHTIVVGRWGLGHCIRCERVFAAEVTTAQPKRRQGSQKTIPGHFWAFSVFYGIFSCFFLFGLKAANSGQE